MTIHIYCTFLSLKVNRDCMVSPWSSWGTVNNKGISTRSRNMLVNPLNNGKECPNMKDLKTGIVHII